MKKLWIILFFILIFAIPQARGDTIVYGGFIPTISSSTDNGLLCWSGTYGNTIKDCSGAPTFDASGNIVIESAKITDLTASRPVETNSDKVLSSGTKSGTGSGYVMSVSPSITGTTTLADVSITGKITDASLNASTPIETDVSKNFVSGTKTGTGSAYVMDTSPTITNAVLVNPALGTPSSGVLTNATGTAAGLTAGNVTTNANLTGDVTSVGNATTLTQNAPALASVVNPKGIGQAVNVVSGAVATMSVVDSSHNNFGTGNFTVGGKFALPDWTPSANQILIQKLTGGVGYQLDVSANGTIRLTLNTTVYSSSAIPSFVNGTAHVIKAVVTVGTTNTTVDFYTDGVALGTQQTAANPGTVTSAAVFYVLGTSAVEYAGQVYTNYLYNRALSAAEVLDLYRNGVAFADKWGSQTSLVTGDNSTFASDTGFWAKDGVTIPGDGYAHFIAAPSYSGIQRPLITQYKRYRYTITLSSWSAGTLRLNIGDAQVNLSQVDGTYTGELTDNGTATTVFNIRGIGESSFNVSAVTLTPIGATLALEPEGIQPDAWYGSANSLNAAYPASGSSLTRYGNKIIALTNTSAPTATAGVSFMYAKDLSDASGSNMWVMDGSGNQTLISPHVFAEFAAPAEEAWSYYSCNNRTKKCINVDMYGAIKAIEELTGRKFIYVKPAK